MNNNNQLLEDSLYRLLLNALRSPQEENIAVNTDTTPSSSQLLASLVDYIIQPNAATPSYIPNTSFPIRRQQRTSEIYHDIIAEYNANFRRYTETIQQYLYIVRQTHNEPAPPQTPNVTPSTPPQTRTRQARTTRPNRQFSLRNINPTQRYVFTNVFIDSDTAESNIPSEEEINQAIRIIPFENNSETIPDNQCAITLEYFQEGEQIGQIIRCGHVFKEQAIRNWLQRNRRCPICRYDIRSPSTANENPQTTATPTDPNPNDRTRVRTQELDQIFGTIANEFSQLFGDTLQYDISFTIPIVYYDMSRNYTRQREILGVD